MLHSTRAVVGLVILLSAPATHAATIPLFQALGAPAGSNSFTENSASASAAGSVVHPDQRTASFGAIASFGGVGARANAAIPSRLEEPFAADRSISAGGRAESRAFDVIISADHAAGPTQVNVSTNFRLDGVFSLGNAIGGDTRAAAGVTVSYGFGPAGGGNTGVPIGIGLLSRSLDSGVLSESHTGVFAGVGLEGAMSVDHVFETPVFLVPVDMPLRLTLRINASASAVSRDGSAATASANFLNTLSLPSLGPVFNLPAGYTANSTDARIADNRFAPTVVPVPASMALLLGGLAVLGGLRGLERRRPLPALPAAVRRNLTGSRGSWTECLVSSGGDVGRADSGLTERLRVRTCLSEGG